MENKSQLLMLFPIPVQVSKITGHEALNEKLAKGIYEVKESHPNTVPESWSCNLYTTIMDGVLLDGEPFSALRPIILEEANKFALDLKMDTRKCPLQITEGWCNVYGRGHAQEIHVHRNSIISGIYYVKTPPGCGQLLLHSPTASQVLEPPITESLPINYRIFGVQPEAGQMVLFRSWLHHSVKPNNIDEDRISIAFNLGAGPQEDAAAPGQRLA